MTETSALILMLLVDLAAVAAVFVVATKWLKGWVLGLVAGILFEVARILLAMAIMSSVHQFQGGDTLVWLVNLRGFGIPILVVLGFLFGTAASQQAKLPPASTTIKQTACPTCKSAIALDMAVVQAKAARAEGGPSQQYKEPCPVCKTELTYDVSTGDVVQPPGDKGASQSDSGTLVTYGVPTE